MSTFQVGQKVICINDKNKAGNSPLDYFNIHAGKIYTINKLAVSNNNNMLYLDEATPKPGCPWYADRFVALEDYVAIQTGNVPSSAPIDDYVCQVCQNTKCSKTEKSCWRCGAEIKP